MNKRTKKTIANVVIITLMACGIGWIASIFIHVGGEYTDRSPLDYYYQGTDRAPIHPETKAKLLYVLEMLAEEGEEKTFRFIKEELVQHKRCMDWHQLEKAE